jgi:signal peptidase
MDMGRPSLRNTCEFLAASASVVEEGYAVRFRAEGWSMFPAIRDGDILEVQPVRASQIRRGDVLLCRTRDTAVAHRVVRTTIDGAEILLELRGDASFAADTPVPFTRVIGRVSRVIRNGEVRLLGTPRARLAGRITAVLWRTKRWIAQRFWARINHTSARSSHARPW